MYWKLVIENPRFVPFDQSDPICAQSYIPDSRQFSVKRKQWNLSIRTGCVYQRPKYMMSGYYWAAGKNWRFKSLIRGSIKCRVGSQQAAPPEYQSAITTRRQIRARARPCIDVWTHASLTGWPNSTVTRHRFITWLKFTVTLEHTHRQGRVSQSWCLVPKVSCYNITIIWVN